MSNLSTQFTILKKRATRIWAPTNPSRSSAKIEWQGNSGKARAIGKLCCTRATIRAIAWLKGEKWTTTRNSNKASARREISQSRAQWILVNSSIRVMRRSFSRATGKDKAATTLPQIRKKMPSINREETFLTSKRIRTNNLMIRIKTKMICRRRKRTTVMKKKRRRN